MTDPWAAAHRLDVRVYYEDTDFSGVVYHASYLRFMERGRTEYLRACGLHQSALHGADRDAPAAFAVRHMTIGFLAAAAMDDLLEVDTRIEAVGGASVTMAQRVRRGPQVLVEATVRLALVTNRRARRLPPDLIAALAGRGRG